MVILYDHLTIFIPISACMKQHCARVLVLRQIRDYISE